MVAGRVKWFSDVKGFGFIIVDGEPEDVFVHFRVIEMAGRKTLVNDQKVELEYERTEKGPFATKVIPLNKEE
ncbi:MAG TPA: hypothetical protein DCW60_02675 [Sutterella sp.]|nr:hypothetical protein [Sutterella sp.]